MIAVALYFVIFNSCLQDVLQQELNSDPRENVLQNKISGNQDDGRLLSSLSSNHEDPNLKKNDISDESQVKNVSHEREMKKDGPRQLKMLGQFRKLRDGIEEGVGAATTFFGGMRNFGGGIFDLISDGTQSFLPFD